MTSLAKKVRSLARGIQFFGPRFLLAMMGRTGPAATKRLKVPWGNFHFRPYNSDIYVYHDIYQEREYDLSCFPQFEAIRTRYDDIVAGGQVPVIIDAGANIGLSAIWFSSLFPQARIIAVEPDAENAELCRLNTRNHGNIHVIAAAIGSESGHVSLSGNEIGWAVQSHRSEHGEVPIVTVGEITESAAPNAKGFICKIDIEGFEHDLFKSNTRWIEDYHVIIIEPHDWMPSARGSSFNFQKTLFGWGQLLIKGENLVFVR